MGICPLHRIKALPLETLTALQKLEDYVALIFCYSNGFKQSARLKGSSELLLFHILNN